MYKVGVDPLLYMSYVPEYFLYGQSNIKTVIIPNNVTCIRDVAFYKRSRLTSVTIPDGVTYIGTYAFGNCTGLTSITMPNSVTSICFNAFGGCKSLTSIDYNGTKSEWEAIDHGDWNMSSSNKRINCIDGCIDAH